MSKRPHWKHVEEIAAILEKSLTPEAEIEHDVLLPVVGRPDRRPRQCDVVITYGESPRETRTIVEVQDRERKPTITSFQGWVVKMREVGAQHLICVSAKGYPESIKSEVRRTHGPTVRLMTLEELEDPVIHPLEFVAPLVHTSAQVCVCRAETVELEDPPRRGDVDLEEFSESAEVFSLGGDETRLDLVDLVARHEDLIFDILRRERIASSRCRVVLGSTERDLWLHIGEETYRVLRLPVELDVEITGDRIPLLFYSYRQETIDGALAWLASARATIGGDEVAIELVFKADSVGILQLARVSATGARRLTLLWSSDRSEVDKALSWIPLSEGH